MLVSKIILLRRGKMNMKSLAIRVLTTVVAMVVYDKFIIFISHMVQMKLLRIHRQR
jgi:hypothetical protein